MVLVTSQESSGAFLGGNGCQTQTDKGLGHLVAGRELLIQNWITGGWLSHISEEKSQALGKETSFERMKNEDLAQVE